MLLDRHVEHLGSAGAVDVAAVGKHFLAPLLPGQPGDDPGLDGAEVGHDKPVSGGGDKSRPDQLREDVRHVAVDQPQRLGLPLQGQLPGEIQGLQMVLGQVLDLHQPAGPAARPGAVELQQTADPIVFTGGVLHSLIFLDAGLGQLLADLQHAPGVVVQVAGEEILDGVLAQVVGGHAFIIQPGGQLLHGFGIVQSGQHDRLVLELAGDFSVYGESRLHERDVHAHTVGVDQRVGLPALLLRLGHRKGFQAVRHSHFGDHVPFAVFLEQ